MTASPAHDPQSSPALSKLAGVLPVFQTPYLADETIDWKTLESEIDWLYARGSNGVVMAMVSEVLRLTQAERETMAERVCQWSRGKGVVVISVGAETSRQAAHFAEHAEASGADAVMAIPPIAVALGEDQLLEYYRRIFTAITIPVIVQDASGYVGRPMPISMQAGLLAEYGERAMFKPEATPIGPRLSMLLAETQGRAAVFEGTGGASLVDTYRRGVIGTMPGAEMIDGIVALWRALKASDTVRIYQLSLPITALIWLQNSLDAFLAVEKHLLVRQGIFKNTLVRGPRGYTLDGPTRDEVDRLFTLLEQALDR